MLGTNLLEVLVEAAVGRVIGDHVQRFTVAQHGRPDEVHAADVHRADQDASPSRSRFGQYLEVVDGHQSIDDVGGEGRHAHHVGQVLAVGPKRAARRAPHPRIIGRQAHRSGKVVADDLDLVARQVEGRVTGSGRQWQHNAPGKRADHPFPPDVAPVNQPFAETFPVARGRGSGRRHATQAAPAVRGLVLALATFLSCLRTGCSVPTRVSLSSPRMKASTRSCATSSWIWRGGLFMK